LPQEDFEKSDSQLVLLGGTEFAKHIVRYVPKESFECWKEAYLAKKVWEDNGFDYIPIEPIFIKSNGQLNAFKMKEGQVGVFAEVLGKNAWDFTRVEKNKHFSEEIKRQEERILCVLKEQLHIDHGHPHEGNFCVEKIGDSVRVYLIDFDRAKKIK